MFGITYDIWYIIYMSCIYIYIYIYISNHIYTNYMIIHIDPKRTGEAGAFTAA